MWPEPLVAETLRLSPYRSRITTRAGDGTPVARVLTVYNAGAGTGAFGEMEIIDPNGGPKQRVRALALLVREALRHGANIGITHAYTPVPRDRAALVTFAQRLSGKAGDTRGPTLLIAGPLHELRTACLRETDADGNLTGGDIADL